MLRLVRSRFVDVKITRLCISKFGELGAELLQLQSCDLFVEVFWQHIDADRGLVGAGVEFDLRQGLVGKEELITYEGWPVPQPRFTRRPSASRMIRLPSGKMTWSTCGLMFSQGILAATRHRSRGRNARCYRR